MCGKKGQVTAFILVGVVMLIGGFLIFNLSNPDQDSQEILKTEIADLSLSKKNIDLYVSSCLNEVVTRGVYFLSRQGGFIYDYEYTFDGEIEDFALSMDGNIITAPSKEFISEELSTFTETSIDFCMNLDNDYPEYIFEYGKPDVDINIHDDLLNVELDYPIELSGKKTNMKMNHFSHSIPIRLGGMLEARDKILSLVDVDSDTFSISELSQLGFQANIMPYDSSLVLLGIYDEESSVLDTPFFFNVALKKNSNIKPNLVFVPDFKVNLGESMTYQLEATDENEDDFLSFYSENGEFIVSPSGLLKFNAQQVGVFEDNVCVTDEHVASDCINVRIVVENV